MVLAQYILAHYYTHSYKVSWNISKGYGIMEWMRIVKTINLHLGSYGIIIKSSDHWYLRQGEQSTRYPDLIHIYIKFHEDIPHGYWDMACTRMFGKTHQRGINWKTKKGGTISLVCDTLSWSNTYSYKVACRYPKQLLSYGVYKNVRKKINQRGIP